jgi:hypothetical protein
MTLCHSGHRRLQVKKLLSDRPSRNAALHLALVNCSMYNQRDGPMERDESSIEISCGWDWVDDDDDKTSTRSGSL